MSSERPAAMEFTINDDPSVMQRATQMAVDSGQHVFDTLYHAVAVEHEEARLITADERYFAKAEQFGRIVRLKQWNTELILRAITHLRAATSLLSFKRDFVAGAPFMYFR